MKPFLQRLCAGAGFTMLLGTAALGASHPAALASWVFTATALLLAGRAFTFQQKQ